EIVDETDVHTNMIERIDATTIIVDPRITVGHVNTVLKTALPCSRQKTIGWLALKHFGRIPKKEDAVTIHDHQFIVEEAEEHRMKRVKIIKTAKARLQ
ncbi:MAG TPA: transporter associated domain-containing protein, partial [Patescibacteria group bacterium]|nr:transporter associated domain-containing protein [Patescibacteria group bacterium]